MKKLLSLLLALAMILSLAACAPAQNETTNSSKEETQPSQSQPAPSEPANNETTVINVADFLGDDSKWENDFDSFEIKDNKLFFDTFFAGEYCAVRLTEEAQNVNYKFNITINELAPVTEEDGTWWDSELLVIARSTVAGNSWNDDLSQKGYTLTSWGDMSEVYIGRCGFDDAFGGFQWNINDGQPHEIEFAVVNNADNTQVTITLKVDGTEIASVVDAGTKIKNERPALYPDAGGLTIRCKWLEVTVE